jgi:GNAT superfamily N-acetyltransferase
MANPGLIFLPIDLEKHGEIAMVFREDSYVASFGDAKLFDRDTYLTWLQNRLDQFRDGHVHVWRNDQIVGQIEARPRMPQNPVFTHKPNRKPEPQNMGYVNLYYLTHEWRGKGIAGALDEYVVAYLLAEGCTRARLTVSETNPRAIRFYTKYGWQNAGTRADHPQAMFMEKILAP